MPKRHHAITVFGPRIWLMTDERLGDRLMDTIHALPKRSGIIFRHYATPDVERRRLFRAVRRSAQKNRHMLILADQPHRATGWQADGSHGRHRGAFTAPVHSVREMRAAERAGARLLFVSPVFTTRSHPGQKAMGTLRLSRMAHQARRPVIALGGMTQARFKALRRTGIYGWAAIDGLSAKRP